MLYYLFNYLDANFNLPGTGIFNFISFRAGVAFIFALIFSTVIGGKIIRMLQQRQIGETIRDLDLEGQMAKKGTPTMGGIIIILSIIVPLLFVGVLDNVYLILMLTTTIWLGIIGFIDDYIKVIKKNKDGLHGKFKIVGQVSIGLLVGLVLYFSPSVTMRENVNVTRNSDNIETTEYASYNIKSTKTTVPFFKNNNFDYADLFTWAGEHSQTLGWIFFVLMTIFVVTAVSNGANLTDGLDGLVTGSAAIQMVPLAIFAYLSGNINYSGYLDIMYIPHSGELLVFAGAFLGAAIGFLWYNSYPAQVFMGDTGSLTIGGIIAVFAIVIHKEILIILLCGVFLVENLSVMMQVSYFKYTKRKTGVGKRIFKMSPLHHHFQKAGNSGIQALIQAPLKPLPESKITMRFWIVGIILAALTIITLKMR